MYSPHFSESPFVFDKELEFTPRNRPPLHSFNHTLDGQTQISQESSGSESSPLAHLGYRHNHAQDRLQSGSPLKSRQNPTIGELLVYPVVQEMWSNLQEAQQRIARAFDAQGHLQAEIIRLASMIQPHSLVNHMYVDSILFLLCNW